jgi:hypothetical protein
MKCAPLLRRQEKIDEQVQSKVSTGIGLAASAATMKPAAAQTTGYKDSTP